MVPEATANKQRNSSSAALNVKALDGKENNRSTCFRAARTTGKGSLHVL